ncbi:hypothetical protein ACEQ6A_35555, partial [Rhizobium brockwellii]
DLPLSPVVTLMRMVPSAASGFISTACFSVASAREAGSAAAPVAEKGLLSARVVASTVDALKLDHDPEFAGASANALGVALDL